MLLPFITLQSLPIHSKLYTSFTLHLPVHIAHAHSSGILASLNAADAGQIAYPALKDRSLLDSRRLQSESMRMILHERRLLTRFQLVDMRESDDGRKTQ